MPCLEKLFEGCCPSEPSHRVWPTRSNFTSALQSVATLNTEERVLRPLLPLGLGLRCAKPHSNAYYFLTAAVLPDQLEKFLIHKITRATFSTLFICKRIANKKIGLGVRGRTLNPFICWSLWYGCPNCIPASHAGNRGSIPLGAIYSKTR